MTKLTIEHLMNTGVWDILPRRPNVTESKISEEQIKDIQHYLSIIALKCRVNNLSDFTIQKGKEHGIATFFREIHPDSYCFVEFVHGVAGKILVSIIHKSYVKNCFVFTCIDTEKKLYKLLDLYGKEELSADYSGVVGMAKVDPGEPIWINHTGPFSTHTNLFLYGK